jgi:AcrR family transcriptional regulator
MAVQERILETALRMFRTIGIKNVTMFDIARECGISKKTVYEHFTDKEELIQAGIRTLLGTLKEEMTRDRNEATDAIEEVIRTTANIQARARTMNPVMLYEVQKYHPEIAKEIEQFRRDAVLQHIRENLQRGMEEGLFSSHFNIDIIARMRQLQLETVFDPLQYPAAEYELQAVMQEITTNYIMGIATLKGRKLAGRYLKIEEQDLTTI